MGQTTAERDVSAYGVGAPGEKVGTWFQSVKIIRLTGKKWNSSS